MSIWTIFDEIAALLTSAEGDALDRKIDGLLAAVSETIADTLPTANQAVLRDGAKAARRALETIAGVDHGLTSFAAGQLAAAADVLGFAAGRAADDEAVTLAGRPAYAGILRALAEGALSNTDLSRVLSRSEEHICRLLRELRQAGLVTTERRGRHAVNILSPVGRLLSEDRDAGSAGMPLHLGATNPRYQLITMTAANDLDDGTELPRLDVATA